MNDLKLIDGKFNPDEAKEILLNLISSKIQFHTIKDFSSEIGIGEPDIRSRKRIAELRTIKEEILSLIEKTEKENLLLEVKSTITISCSPKEQIKAHNVQG